MFNVIHNRECLLLLGVLLLGVSLTYTVWFWLIDYSDKIVMLDHLQQ